LNTASEETSLKACVSKKSSSQLKVVNEMNPTTQILNKRLLNFIFSCFKN